MGFSAVVHSHPLEGDFCLFSMTFTSHYSYSSKMEVASTPGAPGDLYTAGCIDITSSPRAASDDTTDSDVDDEGSSAEVMPCTCKHSQGPRHGSRQSFDTVEIARATPSQKATYNQAPLDSLQLLWQPGQLVYIATKASQLLRYPNTLLCCLWGNVTNFRF